MARGFLTLILIHIISTSLSSQLDNFNWNTDGQFVCMAEITAEENPPSFTIKLLDAQLNNTDPTDIYRRSLYGSFNDWQLVSESLSPGTTSWTDTNIEQNKLYEYQIKRQRANGVAIGYVAASAGYDQSDYRGRMILCMAEDVASYLPDKINRLIQDLTGDGWMVETLSVTKGSISYDDGDLVVSVKNQIQSIYDQAPADDKPQLLFLLGHVPLPRAGQGQQAPDGHIEFSGARGADTYYADLDGVFTDTATYDIPEQYEGLTKNYPGDFRWDQDTMPSSLEMGFGRVDFFGLDIETSEIQLVANYLDRLHNFRHVNSGNKIGQKTAFYKSEYTNSTDASFRCLPGLSGSQNIEQNYNTQALGHPLWVKENGPYLFYMQNRHVPQFSEWSVDGMDALVFSSDQSGWGYGDIPFQSYSHIRRLMGADCETLITLWTTQATNLFHQAGVGEPLGLAMKQIMDHNESNNLLEKPHQEWDTPDWWNRTHFSFYGDPSLRLYQTFPASQANIQTTEGNITFAWDASTDEALAGYFIYQSDSEFGKYEKISNLISADQTSYSLNNPNIGDWFMVRAVSSITTGSGYFLHPSQGVFAEFIGIDQDGDGFNSEEDCDDLDPEVNSEASEIPNNGIDDDCDGIIDEQDNDGDGFEADEDCDDNDPEVNYEASEIPNNGIDDNCDGISVEVPACTEANTGPWPQLQFGAQCENGPIAANFEVWTNETYYVLALEDGQGYYFEFCDAYDESIWEARITLLQYNHSTTSIGTIINAIDACSIEFSYQVASDFPDVMIVVSDRNDCDGITQQIDNGIPSFGCIEGFVDADGDGFTADLDCQDLVSEINPGVVEVPYNGIDDDCDPATPDDDIDGDGFNSDEDCDDADPEVNSEASEIPNNDVDEDCDGIVLIIDEDGDGFNSDVDCDDFNADINPGSSEIPNNDVDEDCDGITLIIDEDGDGFNSDEDCDDFNADINPGSSEIPNNDVDEDCDGIVLIIDEDGDGFNSDEDCDDFNADINPGVSEIPNNDVDEDCDGIALIIDEDGDGFNSDEDCDDADAGINPGSSEIPNNDVDEDCDGIALVIDEDGDGFNSDEDCDDFNADINPGVSEICDELDNNCDGQIDEDLEVATYYVDGDMDGFGDDNKAIEFCAQPPGTSLVGGDCDDADAGINPGASEIPNNDIDEDCDGEDLVSSVNDNELNILNVYPNPSQGSLNIEFSNKLIRQVKLFDLAAEVLQKTETNNRKVKLDLSNFPEGLYILQVISHDGDFYFVKIQKSD